MDGQPYICVNYRPNTQCVQMPGACFPHREQIIADLYDENGFHRSAVVADCRNSGPGGAQQYCDNANKAPWERPES